GRRTAAGLPTVNEAASSSTRIAGGCSTGASRRTSASGYSACSRAEPPPVKNDCSVWAASWTTRSPSTRPTQPRSSGWSAGWNMQSFTPSRLGVHHHVGDRGHRLAHSLLDRARVTVRVRERARAPEPEREEDDHALVGAHDAEVARAGARLLAPRGLDGGGVDLDRLSSCGLGDRLEVSLHRANLGRVAENRRLDLLRNVVRAIERELPRKLQVERDLGPSVHLEHGEIVNLTHVRHGERRGEYALAQRGAAFPRLHVDDDVDPRQRVVQSRL